MKVRAIKLSNYDVTFLIHEEGVKINDLYYGLSGKISRCKTSSQEFAANMSGFNAVLGIIHGYLPQELYELHDFDSNWIDIGSSNIILELQEDITNIPVLSINPIGIYYELRNSVFPHSEQYLGKNLYSGNGYYYITSDNKPYTNQKQYVTKLDFDPSKYPQFFVMKYQLIEEFDFITKDGIGVNDESIIYRVNKNAWTVSPVKVKNRNKVPKNIRQICTESQQQEYANNFEFYHDLNLAEKEIEHKRAIYSKSDIEDAFNSTTDLFLSKGELFKQLRGKEWKHQQYQEK